jgi:hypothetical protein
MSHLKKYIDKLTGRMFNTRVQVELVANTINSSNE